eukprot:4213709-Pleurochrysis_carterae.AAC.3
MRVDILYRYEVGPTLCVRPSVYTHWWQVIEQDQRAWAAVRGALCARRAASRGSCGRGGVRGGSAWPTPASTACTRSAASGGAIPRRDGASLIGVSASPKT